jgi:transposase-like protein
MFNRIRSLLSENDDPLSGKMEVDESLYGGKDKSKHKNKRKSHDAHYRGKAMVFGMVERDGRVQAHVISAPVTSGNVLPHIRDRVLSASMVFTDEAKFDDPLKGIRYGHERVNHAAHVYVSGDAHTNTIEGFWSFTKNGIRGVYDNVSHKHLQMYLNEYAFLFNRRKSLGKRNMFESGNLEIDRQKNNDSSQRLENAHLSITYHSHMFDAFVNRIEKNVSAAA